MKDYFKPAGDLTDEYLKMNNDSVNINNYLLTVVSGIKLDLENEFGTIISEGAIIVSFKVLKQMIDEGNYNIIKAEYFNPDMIAIEYQKLQKTNRRSK